MDTSYSSTFSPKRSKSTAGFGSPSGSKKSGSLKQSKKAKEVARKMETEGKRAKRADDNRKLLF